MLDLLSGTQIDFTERPADPDSSARKSELSQQFPILFPPPKKLGAGFTIGRSRRARSATSISTTSLSSTLPKTSSHSTESPFPSPSSNSSEPPFQDFTDLPNVDLFSLMGYLEASGNANQSKNGQLLIQYLLASLLAAIGTKAYHDWQEKFNAVIAFVDSTSLNAIYAELFASTQGRTIILEARNSFFYRVQKLQTELQKSLFAVGQRLEVLLEESGVFSTLTETQPEYPFEISKNPEQDPSLTIWNLCTLEIKNGNIIFDKRKFCAIILGLHGIIIESDIISYITKLYPLFNISQKLMAIFIIKEIFLYDIHHHLIQDSDFQKNITTFLSQMLKDNFGLGKIGQRIKPLISDLLELKKQFTLHVFIVNYNTLTQWLSHPELQPTLKSFDELVNDALRESSSPRKNLIKAIAREIRMMSAMFYQSVSIRDFATSNVTKNHIIFHTNLTRYLIEKILTQPTDLIVNVLQLLAELEFELCQIENIGPDLNGLMAINAALNNASITRLKSHFSLLDEKSVAIIAAVTNSVLQIRNYKWMRLVSSIYPSTLAFLGVFLSELEFSSENSSITERAEINSKIFIRILEITKAENEFQIFTNTDIASVSTPLTDEKFYTMSQNFSFPIIDLSTAKSIKEIFFLIKTSGFLNSNIIPGIKVGEKTFPPEEFSQQLLLLVTRKINKFCRQEPRDENKTSIYLKRITKLEGLLRQIYEILKNKVGSIDNTVSVPNIFMQLQQTQQLRLQLKSQSALIAEHSIIIASVSNVGTPIEQDDKIENISGSLGVRSLGSRRGRSRSGLK